MAVFKTCSARDTVRLGRRLGKALRGGDVIAFTGGMGAGKTTFCRGVAEALGCTDPVSSPTFAIAHVYRGRITLAHLDAYRAAGPDDLEAAGFYEQLDAGAVIAVEWSENVAEWLEGNVIRVDIRVAEGGARIFTVEGAALG